MKKFLFLFIPVLCYGQSFTKVNEFHVQNSTTTYSTEIPMAGNTAFDTLITFAASGLTDSLNATIYVQSAFQGVWSQGIFIDSIVARGTQAFKFDTTTVGGTTLIQDSVKARWFYGKSISATLKAQFMALTGWNYRYYVTGGTPIYPGAVPGNSPSTTGATLTIQQYRRP